MTIRKTTNFKLPNRRLTGRVSTMAVKGVNNRDLSQLVDTSVSQNTVNYLIDAQGQLIKRKGKTLLHNAGTQVVTMFEKWQDDLYMVAYGTTLARYVPSTDTLTTIKTFTVAIKEGLAYGDYFLTCNGVGATSEKINIIDLATFTSSAIAAAPKANTIYNFQARLIAGGTDTDTTEVYYSAVDDGTNPPFSDWTVGSGLAQAGRIKYRNAGDVNGISSLGSQIIVKHAKGDNAFRIVQGNDGAGVIVQDVVTDFQGQNFGGERGILNTPDGVFYVNAVGIWQMLTSGTTNVPYSRNEKQISIQFGDAYFNDISFANVDIAYNQKNKLLLVTCAKNSTTNNLVIWHNVRTQALGTIEGWNISRFLVDGDLIYGASDIDGKLYQLFNGFDDNGNNIATNFEQEINGKDGLMMAHMLDNFLAQIEASESTEIQVHFDIYDRNGNFIADKEILTLAGNISPSTISTGFGSASWGSSSLSSLGGSIGLTQKPYQFKTAISDFWRLKIRITNNDKLPHVINFYQLDIINKGRELRINNAVSANNPIV